MYDHQQTVQKEGAHGRTKSLIAKNMHGEVRNLELTAFSLGWLLVTLCGYQELSEEEYKDLIDTNYTTYGVFFVLNLTLKS